MKANPITAAELLLALADNKAQYEAHPETYLGYVVKVLKNRIDFFWSKSRHGQWPDLTVNRHGVLCARTKLERGNWFSYTLSPFGDHISYTTERKFAQLLWDKYSPTPAV